MSTIIVYSEAGGVTKTTTAVSLAMTAAQRRIPTLLVDLDPRGAATEWIGVQPDEDWKTITAIISDEEPEGWANDLAIPSPWSKHLRVVPSDRSLSNREREHQDHSELRLAMALEGLDDHLVIVDCPNRQGGMLTQNALAAADGVIFAATASQDGVSGVRGAQESVSRFCRSRERIGAPAHLQQLGTVVGSVIDTIPPRVVKTAIADLQDITTVLFPLIPRRTIVDQVRMTGEWYGDFEKGYPVANAYEEVFDHAMKSLR